MDIAKKMKQFLSFCYLRYLLATELYMMEPWEKIVVHVFLGILFTMFWFFNYSFVVNMIGQLQSTASYTKIVN